MVFYEKAGCLDMRSFKDGEEFNEWYSRQIVVNPDTKCLATKFFKDREEFNGWYSRHVVLNPDTKALELKL